MYKNVKLKRLKICKIYRKYAKRGQIFKSKLSETRAVKGTCYITKKSCDDGGNPKNFFLVTSHFKISNSCSFYKSLEN